jgi:flavin reductase (DIM6/NTAB) family NADH-FMN oxidoreductase RutF
MNSRPMNTELKNTRLSDSRISELFSTVSADDIELNPFRKTGKDWMLLTAGTLASWNTMTASWGGFGFLWRKPAAFAFVRNSRYTRRFMESHSHFTLSFFDSTWKKALMTCGTKSGRNTDKAAETGLVPLDLFEAGGLTGSAVGFEQAQQIFICRKLYSSELAPEDFIDPAIHDFYPQKNFHRMYAGEIEQILVRRDAE